MAKLENWINVSSEEATRLLRLGCGLREGVTDEYDYETFLMLFEAAYAVCGDDLEIILDEIGEWE